MRGIKMTKYKVPKSIQLMYNNFMAMANDLIHKQAKDLQVPRNYVYNPLTGEFEKK